MKTSELLISLAIMCIITYLCRMLTMVLFRKKIKNRFVYSFLQYIPLTVLAAMTFPAVFFSTAALISAVLGTAVAFVLAFFKKGLLVVALSATFTVFIAEYIMTLCGIL